MKEEFVTFEVSKKLKEKGFPLVDYIPTISQVLKWLREEKNIFVVVLIDDDSDYPVTYNIFNGADCVYHHHENYYALSEWSKCEMAGIEHVIDNLI